MGRVSTLVGLVIALVVGMIIGRQYFAPDAGTVAVTETVASDNQAEATTADAEAALQTVTRKMGSAQMSSWPIHGDLGKLLVDNLDAVSGGTLQAKYFEPGALVPALELFDAVSTGPVDAGWSSPGQRAGKEPAMVMFTTIPFGPNMGGYLSRLWNWEPSIDALEFSMPISDLAQ